MITLDQVLLLQEKVETAVSKINVLNAKVSQLESENDALRSKCTELSKALSDKTELVSDLESTQSRIEESIMQTLNRLDQVENSILNGEVDSEEMQPAATTEAQPPVAEASPVPVQEHTQTEPAPASVDNTFSAEFEAVSAPVSEPAESPSPAMNIPSQDTFTPDANGQFDIF